MIENVTNLTNATNRANAMNLTAQSEGTAIWYIWLKTFFLEAWLGNLLLAILIVVTIVAPFVNLWIRKRVRFQELSKKWLEPNVIKFEFDNEGFRCPQQNNQEWAMFFKKVNWSRHYVIKGQIFYKKAEKAVDSYNRLYERVNTELTSIVAQTIDNVDLGLSMRDSGNYHLQESIMPKKDIASDIIKIVTSVLYGVYKDEYKLPIKPTNGGFVLYGESQDFAKSSSEDKLKKLKSLLQPLVGNTDVKDKVSELIKAERKARVTVESYNEVLANAIRWLRY